MRSAAADMKMFCGMADVRRSMEMPPSYWSRIYRWRLEVIMKDNMVRMAEAKTIAVVAHDNKKDDLLAWAKYNRRALSCHKMVATGTTGTLLQAELDLPVTRVQSGPLGGDQQIGAKIS